MPVGRITYFHLGPMSFAEYLNALDPELYGFYSKIDLKTSIADSRHKKLLEKQREYMFTGGMPESVSTWRETGSPSEVQDIQRGILDTYIDDFAKYARKGELIRLQKLFRAIPQLAGKKIKYSNISPDDKAAQVKSAIDMLNKAKICHKVYHSDCSGLPLGAGINEKNYKLLFIDIGLMNNLLGMNWINVKNMDERTLINEGTLAEQFVGQEMLTLGKGKILPELFYWIREGRGNNAEVDYVQSLNGLIIPIEVKSGISGSLRSLHQFVYRKNSKTAVRFDLNKPGSQILEAKVCDSNNEFHRVKFSLISLPVYMAGMIGDIDDL
jgi:predicted AAA+ superfamily ATPase